MTDKNAALLARIAELEAEVAKTKRKAQVSLKVSQKGAVSLYGLGRFPVTLYKGQWEKLLGEAENIKVFLEQNAADLAVKEG